MPGTSPNAAFCKRFAPGFCYRPFLLHKRSRSASIAKKLMIEHDYNVYFTDLFKFYTDETRTEVNKNGKEILKQNVDFLSEANFPSGKDPYTLLLKEIDRIEPERIIIFGNKSEKNIKANIKNVNAEVKKCNSSFCL